MYKSTLNLWARSEADMMPAVYDMCRGTPFEPFPDNLSPEEILAQATASAKEAQQELTMRKPKTDVSIYFRIV